MFSWNKVPTLLYIRDLFIIEVWELESKWRSLWESTFFRIYFFSGYKMRSVMVEIQYWWLTLQQAVLLLISSQYSCTPSPVLKDSHIFRFSNQGDPDHLSWTSENWSPTKYHSSGMLIESTSRWSIIILIQSQSSKHLVARTLSSCITGSIDPTFTILQICLIRICKYLCDSFCYLFFLFSLSVSLSSFCLSQCNEHYHLSSFSSISFKKSLFCCT